MNRRVVVTALGCLSGLAQGVEATWSRLCSGDDAARPLKLTSSVPTAAVDGTAIWIDKVDTSAFGRRFNARLLEQMDLSSVYAIVAAHEALEGSGLLDRPDVLQKAGVFIGCGGGGMTRVEQSYERLFVGGARSLHPMTIPRQMPSAPASQVSMIFSTEGPCFGVTSACASSAHAIAEGAAMIRHGRLDLAIVGGAEAPLAIGSWMAWQALRALARERCRPFSAGRDGMLLGEGAAILVLEAEAHAQARGAEPLAEILGSGASSDAHHMTHPGGTGAVRAIRAALLDSGLRADSPMLISSHGSGTIANDSYEAAALRAAFGDSLDRCTVLATKSAHGHLCGAGGAIELLTGILALRHRLAPPVLHYLGPDPACALPLPLGTAQRIDHTTPALELLRVRRAELRPGGTRMVSASSSNIFVTGATGFLGSHFVREWLRTETGHVFALVRDKVRDKDSMTGASRLTAALEAAQQANGTPDQPLAKGLTAIDGDVALPLAGVAAESLARLRQASVEVFWHFASDLRYGDNVYEAIRRINVDGARNALALASAIGVRRFVYISTAFVCGRQAGLIEETLGPPHQAFSNGYEASKAEAEHLLVAECERLDLPLTILRPSVVIGPRATKSAYGSKTGLFSLIHAVVWVRSSPSGQTGTLRIPACADAEINFIPVDAVVSDMLALARSGFGDRGIYHLTSSSSVSAAQCWSAIADATGMGNVVLVPPGSFQPSPVERLIARRIGFFLSYIETDRRFNRSLSGASNLGEAEFAGYVGKALEGVLRAENVAGGDGGE